MTLLDRLPVGLILSAGAAFSTYFCMYAFRKPFTAGTFEGDEFFGIAIKSALVIAQLLGYMLSKFIGIKVISELRAEHRARAIVGMILFAEAALIGFAYIPSPTVKVVMMFLNGLPLGMVFGLVLAYLEGRCQTEALAAVLCSSFIVASGVVKSMGQWLIQDIGINQYEMPMLMGFIFFVPLLLSVLLLRRTPLPSETDRELRRERPAMDGELRRRFVAAYWPGLALLLFVFIALTVIRTVRDDFAVEIWRDMGVSETPSVFAQTETIVAVLVMACNAMLIWVRGNMNAIRLTMVLMSAAFVLVGGSLLLYQSEQLSPFAFMVACGVGLYVPYVAFHTTVFERIIAASKHPCNLAFLMYLADALGYLGYAVVILAKATMSSTTPVLPYFEWTLGLVAVTSIVALILATIYFEQALSPTKTESSL